MEKLCKMAQEHDLAGNTYLSVKEAFEAAKREAKNTDFIFVGGSPFVYLYTPPLQSTTFHLVLTLYTIPSY